MPQEKNYPKRLEWNEFFWLEALFYSVMGTCDRLRIATLIVKDKRITAAGFNGSLPGRPHCDDVGHHMVNGHCERTRHSEKNSLTNAVDKDSLKDAEAYILGIPCLDCIKDLVGNGVKNINFLVGTKKTDSIYSDRDKILEMMKHYKEILGEDVKIKEVNVDFRKIILQAIERLKGPGGALSGLDDNKILIEI